MRCCCSSGCRSQSRGQIGDLTARLGAQNRELPVVGIDGGTIKPRDLTPGALQGMLIDTGAARFVEVIPPRPQDFNVVLFWVPDIVFPVQQSDFESAAAGSDHSVSDTPVIAIPTITPSTRSGVFLVLGVPLDAPDINTGDVLNVDSGRQLTGATGGWRPDPIPLWRGWEYMGTPFKWWLSSQTHVTTAGRIGQEFRVGYQPYA